MVNTCLYGGMGRLNDGAPALDRRRGDTITLELQFMVFAVVSDVADGGTDGRLGIVHFGYGPGSGAMHGM